MVFLHWSCIDLGQQCRAKVIQMLQSLLSWGSKVPFHDMITFEKMKWTSRCFFVTSWKCLESGLYYRVSHKEVVEVVESWWTIIRFVLLQGVPSVDWQVFNECGTLWKDKARRGQQHCLHLVLQLHKTCNLAWELVPAGGRFKMSTAEIIPYPTAGSRVLLVGFSTLAAEPPKGKCIFFQGSGQEDL